MYVGRPFEGLPSECDIVAMRELVPSATAPLSVKGTDKPVTLCSLLPMAAPAMVRDSGQLWLGLQVQHNFGDPSRDLGAVLQLAIDADEPGVLGLTDPPGAGPRLQDLVTDKQLQVTVHDGFEFWVSDVEDKDELAAALEQANAAANPTARLTQVEAAYWTDVGTKEHLRWVMPEPEDQLLDALARLHVAGKDVIVDGRPAGRACSARTACSPRSGTCPSAPARRRWRTPPRRSPRTSPRRWPTTPTWTPTSGPPAPASRTGRSRSADRPGKKVPEDAVAARPRRHLTARRRTGTRSRT